MKHLKILSALLAVILCVPESWAQKKTFLKSVAKAVAEKPAVSSAQLERPYAQLLAQTKAHIQKTGYRPRACITDERGLRIPAGKLTEEQLREFRLGGVIARTIQAFKTGDLAPNDADLKELQMLVEAHPNPRSHARTITYLDKYQHAQKEEQIKRVYADAVAYIAAHHRRPRSTLYDEGVRLSQGEVKKNYPEFYPEIHLGAQISSLIQWSKKNSPDHPVINRLQQLLLKYGNSQANKDNLAEILENLRTFLNIHNRPPRRAIFRDNKRLKQAELSPQEQGEVLLAFHLDEVLDTEKSVTFSEENKAALEEIKNLLNQFLPPMPSAEELLAQANAWVAAHQGFRPRQNFLKDKENVPVRELLPEKYEEILLARRILYVVSNATEITPQIEGLQRILELPVRPQSRDEVFLQDVQLPEAAENAYDDFEEYFK